VKAFSLVLCLWSVAACRPPEAPETLDDLASFLFAHTWDDDETYLQPGLENLMVWLDANFDQTSEGYEVTNITPEAVASVAGEDRALEGLIGAAVGYDIPYPLADVVDVMLFEDPMEVYPGDYEFYDREFLTDTLKIKSTSRPIIHWALLVSPIPKCRITGWKQRPVWPMSIEIGPVGNRQLVLTG
jgi:hypothetical protein